MKKPNLKMMLKFSYHNHTFTLATNKQMHTILEFLSIMIVTRSISLFLTL